MAKLDLRVVDENFTAQQGASRDDVLKAHQAAGIREGKRRAHEQLADTIKAATVNALQPVKDAHAQELDRIARTIGKAAHRDGVLQGILFGVAGLALVLAGAWFWVLKDIVYTNTAMQRVNYPNPPQLQEPESSTSYPRINPREPGDAP